MADNEKMAQEPRTERAAVMLTPEEKRAVRLLSAARDTSESDYLRERLDLGSIVKDYERLKPAIAKVG